MSRRWYEEAFGPHYLTVYPHRDDASASDEAGFGIRALGVSSGDRILDLACGAGRHSRALAVRGLDVTGLDLSPELIAEAVRRGVPPGARLSYLRGDMRALPLRRAFRAVTLFFTSFGYFDSETEDLTVLREAARVLRSGGRILLDAANRDRVISGLVPESEEERNGLRITQVRSISPDGARVLKTVRLSRAGAAPVEYTESVRLYSPGDLVRLLDAGGFDVTSRFGDLAGAEYGPESPRFVAVGRLRC